MSVMTYDLGDDLQIAVHVMGDGRLTLSIDDDRLKTRRCWLEWDDVRHLMRRIKDCERRVGE